ncbi:MAG: ribonuclease III [Bacteroidia bacterium]|nr:ribonuclease III [Bacteroidia bacterium]MDW8159184.1 ribonuclease III [Bacteroidia bacterium]
MRPRELALYELAFRHSSLVTDSRCSAQECNERLEFLGDSILSAAVSEFLFKKYPSKNEGFLTEMRSKIVNRARLNELGFKLGLDAILRYNKKLGSFNRSICGNALEALIGAIYLDLGYRAAQYFIIHKMINIYLNLDELETQNHNYKSQLMEFAQKHKIEPIIYEVVEETFAGNIKEFTVACIIQDKVMGLGKDTKKKVAEQKASEMALLKLCS